MYMTQMIVEQICSNHIYIRKKGETGLKNSIGLNYSIVEAYGMSDIRVGDSAIIFHYDKDYRGTVTKVIVYRG